MDRTLVAMVLKNGDSDCEVWYPEIPMDEPLLQELFKKYETSGCSVAGTFKEIEEDMHQTLSD